MRKILLVILISGLLLLTASSAVSAGSTLDGGNKTFFKKNIYMDHVKGHIERYPKILAEKFPLIFAPSEWVTDAFYSHLRIVVDSGVVTIGDTIIETPCTLNVFLFKGDYTMWDKLGFHDPNDVEDLTVDASGFWISVS